MGTWAPLLTNLSLQTIALLDDYESIDVTPKLGAGAEVVLALKPGARGAGAIAPARTALKLYDDEGTPRFFGKVWEPYGRGPGGLVVPAKDPLAEHAGRRIRQETTYTAQDAGDIAIDRVAVQNSHRTTYLRALAANRDLSVNRTRVYGTGKREGEVLDELANAADGFWYRATPVDGVVDVMADLHILFPDAGVTREDVRFEYGEDTTGTLETYELTELLPRNRFTVASSNSSGGRLAKVAENAASIAEFGLFEDETTFSDVTDGDLLQQQADASLSPNPPRVVQLTPADGAPLVLFDFDVGDFVRLRILHEPDDIFEWVRVLEATLRIDGNGLKKLTNLIVEFLPGGQRSEAPETLFRRELDEARRRLEALERRVENQDVPVTSPPAAPAPSDPDEPDAPAEPPPPPPPPPPAPSLTPVLGGVSAVGINYIDGGVLRQGVEASVAYDARGLSGEIVLTCNTGGVVKAFVSGTGTHTAFFQKGPGSSHDITANMTTSGGSASSGPVGATVPAVTQS